MTDASAPTTQTSPDPHRPKVITIHIDHHEFKVDKGPMTGQQLRDLPDPPIGPDRDLYLEIHGKTDDELIENDQVVELKEGMRFFTAPAHINPGRAA